MWALCSITTPLCRLWNYCRDKNTAVSVVGLFKNTTTCLYYFLFPEFNFSRDNSKDIILYMAFIDFCLKLDLTYCTTEKTFIYLWPDHTGYNCHTRKSFWSESKANNTPEEASYTVLHKLSHLTQHDFIRICKLTLSSDLIVAFVSRMVK